MDKKNLFEKMKLRKKNIIDSESGVATTVGTIMALLIFLSLLSMVTQQYVPVWMEDKEAYHMDQTMEQFGYLKGSVDSLIMNDYKDYPMYSSIRLGSEGVPLFASQTPGVVRLSPDDYGNMDISFTDSKGSPKQFTSTGNLSLEVLNRYFEQQSIIYEGGAIILEQSQKSVIRADPAITIDKLEGGNYSVRITLVDIIGEDLSVGGTDSVGVTTELWSSTRRNFRGIDNFNLSIRSLYPHAWKSWLINETGIKSVDGSGNLLNIDLGNDVYELRLTYARVNMEISV